jgi:hypothetical protein
MDCRVIDRDGNKVIVKPNGTIVPEPQPAPKPEPEAAPSLFQQWRDQLRREGDSPWAVLVPLLVGGSLVAYLVFG